MSRLFFAVWPDPPAAGELHRLAADSQADCGGRSMRRDSLHLTLAFLGEVADQRRQAAIACGDAAAGGSFDLSLHRLGYWPHNRILWAGGESQALSGLAACLAGELRDAGFTVDRRPFVAHMTLLRDARCTQTPVMPRPVRWRVGELLLVESQLTPAGARYQPVHRWMLQ